MSEKKLRAVTLTMIFEADALNRDDKIGGNILSIKKLSINGETYPFLSKVAIRHYLWNTLNRAYPEDWNATAITGESGVLQFNLKSSNIITSAELDAFGYMYTIAKAEKNKGKKKSPAEEGSDKEENSSESGGAITRKSPLGITKAVALTPWHGDMQFNANHDLVHRAQEQGLKVKGKEPSPDPYNKEEYQGAFKVTFTLDLERFGQDIWPSGKGLFEDNGVSVDGKVKFTLPAEKKKERVGQILETLHDGLIYHTSGENSGIVPKFIVAAGLSVPMPVFHSFVDKNGLESEALKNSYIIPGSTVVWNKMGNGFNAENLSDWGTFQKTIMDKIE